MKEVLISLVKLNTTISFRSCFINVGSWFKIFRFLVQAKEAKVEISAEQITFDNRVRQYHSPDQIFNYFSSIQLVNKSGQ